MTTDQDRRGATRVETEVEVELEVELQAGECVIQSAKTRDVSLTGLYIYCPDRLEMNSDCRVTLYLDGRKGEKQIRARGKVARLDAEGMGVEFREVSVDSFLHLRELLLFNAPNREQIERELSDQDEMREAV